MGPTESERVAVRRLNVELARVSEHFAPELDVHTIAAAMLRAAVETLARGGFPWRDDRLVREIATLATKAQIERDAITARTGGPLFAVDGGA